MKQVLQIGAGNIGRGLIGRIFYEAGYQVMFADVNTDMIQLLNKKKQYLVECASSEITVVDVKIKGAINSQNQETFNETFKDSSVITTAVGASILKFVATNIIQAIESGFLTSNKTILACENYVRASSYLKTLVYSKLSQANQEIADRFLVFADVAVDCIVPPVVDIALPNVRVETFFELVVEESEIQDDTLLNVQSIIFANQVTPYIERKLYTLNASHAFTAYLGYRLGHESIESAIYDQRIEPLVRAYMKQIGDVLVAKHGFDLKVQNQYIETIIQRFKNPYLKDQVVRVGRELLRKIGEHERFVAPIVDALNYQVDHEWLNHGLAVALAYNNQDDLDVQVLKRLMVLKGDVDAIKLLTGIQDIALIEILIQERNRIEVEGLTWMI